MGGFECCIIVLVDNQDYKWEDRKNGDEFRGDIGAIR